MAGKFQKTKQPLLFMLESCLTLYQANSVFIFFLNSNFPQHSTSGVKGNKANIMA